MVACEESFSSRSRSPSSTSFSFPSAASLARRRPLAPCTASSTLSSAVSSRRGRTRSPLMAPRAPGGQRCGSRLRACRHHRGRDAAGPRAAKPPSLSRCAPAPVRRLGAVCSVDGPPRAAVNRPWQCKSSIPANRTYPHLRCIAHTRTYVLLAVLCRCYGLMAHVCAQPQVITNTVSKCSVQEGLERAYVLRVCLLVIMNKRFERGREVGPNYTISTSCAAQQRS